jgi:hypothetical protein
MLNCIFVVKIYWSMFVQATKYLSEKILHVFCVILGRVYVAFEWTSLNLDGTQTNGGRESNKTFRVISMNNA